MSFSAPELLPKKNPKTCTGCGQHVNNATSPFWDSGHCPSCYGNRKLKQNIHDDSNPLYTVVKAATISPFSIYLDRYTPFEMRMIKEEENI